MFNILKGLWNFFRRHPLTKQKLILSMANYIFWQLKFRFFNKKFIYNFIGDVKVYVFKSNPSANGNIYAGLYDFEDMSFLLHFLKTNEIFIDIGANVGTYTLLAAGYKKNVTIAIEPVPTTYKLLEENIKLNDITNVKLLNLGLGRENGKLKFTSLDGGKNRVYHNDYDTGENIEVDVTTLDDIVSELELNNVVLMKIDVEGFEYEVLSGGNKLLSNPNLLAIIIEIDINSLRKFNASYDLINNHLSLYNFNPYRYDPFERKLYSVSYAEIIENGNNAIFIKNIIEVNKRLLNASSFKIKNKNI